MNASSAIALVIYFSITALVGMSFYAGFIFGRYIRRK